MKHLVKFAIAGLIVVSASIAQATELKLAHFMSPNHPYHETVFNWLGNKLDEATGGDLTIRVYPGGALGAGPVEQFNRAIDGVADITFAIQGYTAAQFPRTLIMELPGLLGDPAAGPSGFENAIGLIGEEYARVKLLGLWNIDRSVLYTRDKPVRSLEDVQGLKIRVASKGGADLVEAWGGVPVFMPVTEMYTALQTGVVDGALIDPSATLSFRLGEVTNYMTVGMDSVVSTFMLVMNRDSYRDLSDSQRAALDAASGVELAQHAHDVYAAISARGQSVFAGLDGKEVITLEGDVLAAFNSVATEVREAKIAELEAQGIPAGDIVNLMQGN